METDQISLDKKYMRRCLQLAQNGQQNAKPNPMVGAVIVADGRIILQVSAQRTKDCCLRQRSMCRWNPVRIMGRHPLVPT